MGSAQAPRNQRLNVQQPPLARNRPRKTLAIRSEQSRQVKNQQEKNQQRVATIHSVVNRLAKNLPLAAKTHSAASPQPKNPPLKNPPPKNLLRLAKIHSAKLPLKKLRLKKLPLEKLQLPRSQLRPTMIRSALSPPQKSPRWRTSQLAKIPSVRHPPQVVLLPWRRNPLLALPVALFPASFAE
jgi:hypothetical protein